MGFSGNLIGGLLRKRGGVSFSPSDVTGLVLWLDAAIGVYQEHNAKTTVSGNGDPVGTWEDQSGNSNDLVAIASDTRRPTLNTNQINGLPAVVADGTNDYLSKAFTLGYPLTIYMVMKQVGYTSGDRIVGGAAAYGCLFQFGTSPSISLYAGAAAAANTDCTTGYYHIVKTLFNGANSAIKVDNNSATTGDAGTTYSFGGVRLFADKDPANYGNAAIAEIVVYNQDTSASDTDLFTYFNTKYSIY